MSDNTLNLIYIKNVVKSFGSQKSFCIFVKQIKDMMDYIKIKDFQEENNLKVDLTLTLVEIKILHNACVDVVNEFPDMVGYKKLLDKLSNIINVQNDTLG